MALPHGDERDWLSQEPPKSVVSVLVGFADGRHVLLKDDGTVLEHFFSDIPDEMVGTPEAVRELVRAFAILRAKWIQDDFPDSVGKWKAKTFNEEQYKLPPERHLEKLVERRKQGESIDPDVFLPPRPDIFKKTKESFEERFQQRVDWDKKHEYREWSWAACFLMSLGDKENWSFHADRTENGWRVRTPLSALDCRATIQYTFVIENGKMNVERRVLIYSPFTEGTPRELPKTAKQQTP